MKKLLTLCFIHTDHYIVLAMKKRGFGEGRWNGYGGKVKVEENETAEQALAREFYEESRADLVEAEKRGELTFHFEGDPVPLETHIYRVLKYDGDLQETDEMKPEWFTFEQIPYKQMWPADERWLPDFLSGEYLKGDVFFKNHNELIDCNIKSVKKEDIT